MLQILSKSQNSLESRFRNNKASNNSTLHCSLLQGKHLCCQCLVAPLFLVDNVALARNDNTCRKSQKLGQAALLPTFSCGWVLCTPAPGKHLLQNRGFTWLHLIGKTYLADVAAKEPGQWAWELHNRRCSKLRKDFQKLLSLKSQSSPKWESANT